MLEGVDGRHHVARRYAEVAGAIAVDLGGDDHLTELQRHLIRSVAGMAVLREDLDARAVNGEAVNTSQYCRLANSTRRVAPKAWWGCMPSSRCKQCNQLLVEIDNYGERLIGCIECNRWSWRGSKRPMELPEDDLEALKAVVASRERANPRT